MLVTLQQQQTREST